MKQDTDAHFSSLEDRIDARFSSAKKHTDASLHAMKQDMDARFSGVEEHLGAQSDALGVLVNVAAADGVAPRGDKRRPRPVSAATVDSLLAALAPACGTAEQLQLLLRALCEQLAPLAWPTALDNAEALAARAGPQARRHRQRCELRPVQATAFERPADAPFQPPRRPAARRKIRRAPARAGTCVSWRKWRACSLSRGSRSGPS